MSRPGTHHKEANRRLLEPRRTTKRIEEMIMRAKEEIIGPPEPVENGDQ
jgi:hypothetical protein